MKVLHITHSIDKSVGGPSRSVPQSCIELAKLGIAIELITQDTIDKVDIPKIDGLKVNYLSISQLYVYGSKLSAKEVDLIHLQHIWNPYIQVMAFWAHKKNIPYIVTPRGMLEPWIMANNSWKKKIAMFLYQDNALKRADHIHATAQMEKDNIQALGYTNPITIIPNGIDLSEVKSVKNTYGNKKMIFLSRIHPKKGIELLLEAWRTTNTSGRTLEIAGNGDATYINSLRQSAHNINNVSFVGSKYGDDKWDYLRSGDVMVLPTYSENFGIVVAEALAVGLPVITTTGTPWEDLEKFRCGWWIDLSVQNLQSTLQKVFDTPIYSLEKMGINGKKLVQEKYDIKQIAEHINILYNTI
jgi:glycosyltransferase involved in cell wall biosynthesis